MTEHEFDAKLGALATELHDMGNRIAELTEALLPSLYPSDEHQALARRAAGCAITKADEARLWLAEMAAQQVQR